MQWQSLFLLLFLYVTLNCSFAGWGLSSPGLCSIVASCQNKKQKACNREKSGNSRCLLCWQIKCVLCVYNDVFVMIIILSWYVSWKEKDKGIVICHTQLKQGLYRYKWRNNGILNVSFKAGVSNSWPGGHFHVTPTLTWRNRMQFGPWTYFFLLGWICLFFSAMLS